MYDNIRAGKYQTKLTIIPKPKMPNELRLTASMMTGPQLKAIPQIKADYDKALQESDESLKAYNVDQNRLNGVFEADCAKECGIEDHPKRGKLFGIAWDLGHSSGLSEVWLYYQRLSELLQ